MTLVPAIAPLSDFRVWVRSSGLEIILFVLGAVLLGRFIRWAGDRITSRIDTESARGDGLVRSEASKHRHTLAQVFSWLSDRTHLGRYGGAGARSVRPFGTDLGSARALNAKLHEVFDERQVFRIDHFLGKEAVQNLLAVRFANGMFEPVWNRRHIDHVQIDVPETLSIGARGRFYEGTGAYRDMVVTHLFHLLGFVAMEPPAALTPEPLNEEEAKVFDAMGEIRPEDVVRGQYAGYRQEHGVAPTSDSETFVAVRACVETPRWTGVPFYLRTGKCLAQSAHLLTIAFKPPHRRMFSLDARYLMEDFGMDHLTFELGDPGSIQASFLAKAPGPTITLGEAAMSFEFADAFGGTGNALEAYERLVHDVMIGDHTLFATAGGIERLWEVSAPLLDLPPRVESYEPGSWGPTAAAELISPRRWHLPAHRF